ncbi:MAG: gamma-glutamyltransferase [Alphaproteobacteria bacterium]
MRDFHQPTRSAARAMNAMVSTSQPSSTLAGLEMLRAGGNAIDAAIAAVAVQCVTEPGSTGIGGDCFCLYKPANGPLVALNGSGRAPAAANASWFADQGIAKLETTSPHTVTIPGAVDAWAALLRDHGTKSLGECLQAAIGYAENGFAVHDRASLDWQLSVDKLSIDPAAKAIMLRGGAPKEGTVYRQPELAATLKKIAKGGRDAFYTGEVAEDLVNHLRSKGGLHTLDDFADSTPEYVTPIVTDYKGYQVYECPPNGVGIIALLMLNMWEGFDQPDDPLSITRLHRMAEVGKLGIRDRNAYVADPNMADVPQDLLLSKGYADRLRALVDDKRALTDLPPPGLDKNGDTVYLCVVDKDGNACSFINSTFHGFGSGIVGPKTGVILQNRGWGFNLEQGHPNAIQGGKRPAHTIIPGMLMKDGEAVMPFGVMGGNYQPVGHTWLLSNMIDYGMDAQAAVALPRVMSYGGKMELETTISPAMASKLRAMGHDCTYLERPHGGGQAIWIDRKEGVLTGGSETRKDGLALGY